MKYRVYIQFLTYSHGGNTVGFCFNEPAGRTQTYSSQRAESAKPSAKGESTSRPSYRNNAQADFS